MHRGDSHDFGLYGYCSPNNFAQMNVAEKISDIVPGWPSSIHALRQDRKFFYLVFGHFGSNAALHKGYDH